MSTIFCQTFIFSLKNYKKSQFFLSNCKSSFCSGDIQVFVTFFRVASDFCNGNSGTKQEHFKNISILFKNIGNIENIITTDLKGFFYKKA